MSEERCNSGVKPVLFILCCFVFHGVELIIYLPSQN